MRSLVALEVSEESYADIRARVIASGYGELIIKGPFRDGGVLVTIAGSNEAINMDGIAIVRERPKKPVHVCINGKYINITGEETLSFDRVVKLAGMKGHPTIIWRVPWAAKDSGTLLPGASITIRDSMTFDCVHTGDA